MRAFEEAGDVEARVGGEDRADARPGGRQIGQVAGVGRRSAARSTAALTRGSTTRIGVGRLQDRLLLMAGALAEHAVQAQADEQGDEGEDDDDGQS